MPAASAMRCEDGVSLTYSRVPCSERYDEEYVKVGGQWKFKRLRLSSWFWAAFEQGWTKRR